MANTEKVGARAISPQSAVSLGLVFTIALGFVSATLWITGKVNEIHQVVLPALAEIKANTGAMREDISEIRTQMRDIEGRLREIEQSK